MHHWFEKCVGAVIFAGTFFVTTAHAAGQESSPPKPITVKWAASGDVSYYQSGKMISDEKGLKAVIGSANDPLAAQLLERSEGQETTGTIGLIGGTVLIGAGLTMSTLDIIGHNGWDGKVDAETAITVLGGLSVDVLSLLVLDESTTTKFASVERYNQVVRKEADLSLCITGGSSLPGLRLALGI